MATTTRLRDYMLRPLQNDNPGVTDPALDYIGRDIDDAVGAGADFLGRLLIVGPWAATSPFGVGTHVELSTGEVLRAVVPGTTGAVEPVPPGYGNTVVDGDVTWSQLTG